MKYKLRPSIALVELENGIEFFKSNIRKIVALEGLISIKEFLLKLDGKKDIEKIMDEMEIKGEDREDALNLVNFLNEESILLKIDEDYVEDQKKYPRVFNLLEDYSRSKREVNERFKKLKESKVMIIGLGAVGTWVAHNLTMMGVKNFILVDGDRVELSNLHRQIGYFPKDRGRYKTVTLKERLLKIDNSLSIETLEENLDEDFFKRNSFSKVDMIINCGDYPSVDVTSNIIGKYGMENKIPHLIGGGYNLHMTLVGQVVIPGKTSCVKCFQKHLEGLNEIDTENIKKLQIGERKIGSFPPLSTLSASITSNEAFKVLCGLESILVMDENRCEFLLRNMNFKNIKFHRRKDCEWCGEKGKYYKI